MLVQLIFYAFRKTSVFPSVSWVQMGLPYKTRWIAYVSLSSVRTLAFLAMSGGWIKKKRKQVQFSVIHCSWHRSCMLFPWQQCNRKAHIKTNPCLQAFFHTWARSTPHRCARLCSNICTHTCALLESFQFYFPVFLGGEKSTITCESNVWNSESQLSTHCHSPHIFELSSLSYIRPHILIIPLTFSSAFAPTLHEESGETTLSGPTASIGGGIILWPCYIILHPSSGQDSCLRVC